MTVGWSLLSETITEFAADRCAAKAAALAYYTMFSLAPLLVLVIMLGALWLDAATIEDGLSEQITSVVGQDGAAQIQEMVQAINRPDANGFSAVIGVITLLLGASGVMGQLQTSLNDVWEVRPDPDQGGIKNFIIKRLFSIAMLFALAFLLLTSLVASSLLKVVGSQLSGWLPGDMSQWGWMAVHEGVIAATATVMFAGMFKLLPDAEIRWFDVWVGGAITAVLLSVGKFAIGVYLGSKNLGSVYGAAGSLVLVLVWVYYSATIVLFGAELTQVWARRFGRGIRPSPGAVRVIEDVRRAESSPVLAKPL